MKVKPINRKQKQKLIDLIGKNIVLSIGIDHYSIKDDCFSLCEKDATDVYSAFVHNPKLNMNQKESVLLLDSQVEITKTGILDVLRNLCKNVNGNENLIVFYSGHGCNIDNTFHFQLDSDIYNNENILSIEDVLDIIKPSKFQGKTIIIDACQSIVPNRKGCETYNIDFNKRVIENSNGIAVIYSCSPGEGAQEKVLDYQNSVFTSFLLEGLQGTEDALAGHYLTVKSLSNYLSFKSEEISNGGIQGVKQHPFFYYLGSHDVFIGLFSFSFAENEQNNNFCMIHVDDKPGLFDKPILKHGLKCLLAKGEWQYFKDLVNELVYNIYKYNKDKKNLNCSIEVGKRFFKIIDDGIEFNPITLINKYESNSTSGLGAEYLTKTSEYIPTMSLSYEYLDTKNVFTMAFEKDAFDVDAMCVISVDVKSYFSTEIIMPEAVCKCYYYKLGKMGIAKSHQRDVTREILEKIPEDSKLCILDQSGTPEFAIRAFGIDERIIYSSL